MKSENETPVFATRLKLARKMAGMSLQKLSDTLNNQVSKQALNKYELGLMNPTSDVLMALSKALEVKPEYFLKANTTKLGEIQFRKKASLSKKDEDALVEKARDYFERFLEIESILAIENQFSNPLGDILIETFDHVEKAALKLREVWNLGLNPITNLVEMLEQKGVKVFLIDAVDDIDGFATATDEGVPLVMINTYGKSPERIRFTILHELAHVLLVLSDKVKSTKKREEEYCHYFSSCFLIPEEELVRMIGEKRTYIKIAELINIKEYFGISIRAIVHRLKKIEVITETYYRRWVIFMSKTYGARNEPGEYRGIERSTCLDQLINRAFAEGLISMGKAASLSNVSTNEFRKREG